MNTRKASPLFGFVLGIAVLVLIAWGTLWPIPPAEAWARGQQGRSGTYTWLLPSSRTPEEAVSNLADEISLKDWNRAYNSLANKNEFTEFQFEHDLTDYYPSLRTEATLQNYEVLPLHATADSAEVQLKLHWATVIGANVDSRNLHVVRVGDQWRVDWPIVLKPVVPAQVVAEDFPRWSIVTPGAGDVLGRINNVSSPHVTILDMHPVQRAEGLVILGEVRNDDTAPVNVSLRATLLSSDKQTIASEGPFDNIVHILLPQQVSPFLIVFPNQQLSNVASIRMEPSSFLISGPDSPAIQIQDEKLNPAPDASLSGNLINPSGEPISVVHIIGALYDKNGNMVWMVQKYLDRALYQETPTPFNIPIPEDLARKIATQRTIVATYDYAGSI